MAWLKATRISKEVFPIWQLSEWTALVSVRHKSLLITWYLHYFKPRICRLAIFKLSSVFEKCWRHSIKLCNTRSQTVISKKWWYFHIWNRERGSERGKGSLTLISAWLNCAIHLDERYNDSFFQSEYKAKVFFFEKGREKRKKEPNIDQGEPECHCPIGLQTRNFFIGGGKMLKRRFCVNCAWDAIS